MNIFKLCFLICKCNFSPGLQYDKENIHEDRIRKFSLLHKFCFAVLQLPGLTRLKIAWLVNFSQDYIKILGNYILSFQITNKHIKIYSLKYYLPKILKWTSCLWQLSSENKKWVPDLYLSSIPAFPRGSSPGSGMPGHTPTFFKMKNLFCNQATSIFRQEDRWSCTSLSMGS